MFTDFREGGEGEKQLPPIYTPTGDRTHNLGMHPDQGSEPTTFCCTGGPLQLTKPLSEGYLPF